MGSIHVKRFSYLMSVAMMTVLIFLGTELSAQQTSVSKCKWNFLIEPYGFLPNIKTTARLGDLPEVGSGGDLRYATINNDELICSGIHNVIFSFSSK